MSVAFTMLLTVLAPLPASPAELPSMTRDVVAVAVALDDATIVAIFDAANTADIETGALGAKRGSAKSVRDYGAMLVAAHAAARQQGRDLAKQLGVTPTPPKDDPSSAQHAAAMKALRAVSVALVDWAPPVANVTKKSRDPRSDSANA